MIKRVGFLIFFCAGSKAAREWMETAVVSEGKKYRDLQIYRWILGGEKQERVGFMPRHIRDFGNPRAKHLKYLKQNWRFFWPWAIFSDKLVNAVQIFPDKGRPRR
jgi:hypothetical protein